MARISALAGAALALAATQALAEAPKRTPPADDPDLRRHREAEKQAERRTVVVGDDTILGERRSGPAPRKAPDTSPAGLERLRQAELKRARRAERLKKGMTHG